jgi:YD repeat-containing protein
MEGIVFKRMSYSLFLSVALLCALGRPAAAQSQSPIPSNCMPTILWYYPDPLPFGWFFYLSYPGTYGYLIAAMTCAPPCPSCNNAGKPIELATGDTSITEQDIRIPGLGGGLSLSRTWNSVWPSGLASFETGMFGPLWRSTYEERIVTGTDNFVRYIRGDGTFWSFGSAGPVTLWAGSGPGGPAVEVILNTDTSTNPYFTLTFGNGEQRRFNSTNGNLIAIIDPNGNTTTITYDSSGRLSTITDPVSRTMTFTYGNSTFPGLATSVSTSAGISYSYSYDSQGRLSQVTKPDTTTVSFTYDSQSRITTVTDSNGKVLESHTYDSSNRGLTSSQANGVQAITITYP